MLMPGMSERFLSHGGTIFDTQSPMHIHELLQKFLFNAADSERDAGQNREHDGAEKSETARNGSNDDEDCMV
jgi:hypothetical protein